MVHTEDATHFPPIPQSGIQGGAAWGFSLSSAVQAPQHIVEIVTPIVTLIEEQAIWVGRIFRWSRQLNTNMETFQVPGILQHCFFWTRFSVEISADTTPDAQQALIGNLEQLKFMHKPACGCL